MNRKWQRGEITAFVMLGILALIGVATFINTSINKTRKPIGTFAQTPSCPYNSNQNVPLGSTEQDQANMENRWPISQHRHEYDFYSYFVPASIAEAQSSAQAGTWGMNIATQSEYINYIDQPGGPTDNKVAGLLGSMFGYKPNQLTDAYFMKYSTTALQGADTLVKGKALALKVPIAPNDPVKMPSTQYDIGGGKEAMVVFAAADRITLHIGRHEYFVGSGGNNCNGGPCSGGYWIYIRGICVDQKIQDAYNSAKAAQESAGANKTPITLPEIFPGQTLGLASGNSVEVIVRDNGELISIHRPFYWSGVPARDFGTAPTATPTTPVGVTPTITAPPGAQCGYQGLRCCTPADPVPPGTSCYAPNACVNNVCGTAPPTATPTTNPNAPTWTPTPSPNAPTTAPSTCKTLRTGGANSNHYTVVFLPSGYDDYTSFTADAEEAISFLEKSNIGKNELDKLSFKIHSITSKQYYDVKHCSSTDPSPCFNHNLAKISMRVCKGDAFAIIVNAAKKQENPVQFDVDNNSWGYGIGWTWGLGSGEMMILRGYLGAFPHELAHALAGAHDEYSFNKTSPLSNTPPLNCSIEKATDGTQTSACPKWSDQSVYPGAGCYTSCGYTDWNRPTNHSTMNSYDETNPDNNKFNSPVLQMFKNALSAI